jgi:hypothetical protein
MSTILERLTDEQRRALAEHVPDAYRLLAEEGAEPKAPETPTDLHRRHMSTSEAAKYIEKHGADAYLALPFH